MRKFAYIWQSAPILSGFSEIELWRLDEITKGQSGKSEFSPLTLHNYTVSSLLVNLDELFGASMMQHHLLFMKSNLAFLNWLLAKVTLVMFHGHLAIKFLTSNVTRLW